MNPSTYIPDGKIKSNFAAVQTSLGVIFRKPKNWSVQQRIPGLLRAGILQDRQRRAELLAEVKEGGGIKKSFLLARRRNNKFYPVGVGAQNRGFQKLESLTNFAKKLGRTHLRVIGGVKMEIR